jgi:CRP-like cAMP-binding protein
VWIVREGLVELFVGSGRQRQVVQVLRPGDIDGDAQLLLGMPFPYSARAATDTVALYIESSEFERLLVEHPAMARIWLTSVAARVSNCQRRILALLGRSLTVQVAGLVLDEAIEGQVPLPQRTLAAMLGVQRPSLNKVLKELEKQGLVEIGYGRITVRNPGGLAGLMG